MRRCLIGLALMIALPACGGSGGGSSTTPTSPTSTAPAAAPAAEFEISVTVGNRPFQVQQVSDPQATGRADIVIEILERRNRQGQLRKLIARLRKRAETVATETLEEAALRLLAPGGSLTIPGGGRLSIPYQPRFPFTRDDEITVDIEGEFLDTAGNTTRPTSPPVAVPANNIATCVASPNHLCLNNQRFQVDVLVNGARVTTMQRENDTDGRYVFEDLVLIAKVLNACGLTNRYRVELIVNAPRLAFTVFVTDTLVGLTKTYVTAGPPVTDPNAFATCP